MYISFSEENNNSSGKKTVADVVREGAKRLVEMNGHASLAVLKNFLASENGSDYVARNYERIKVSLKKMFESEEVQPVKRMKSKSVAVQFKFKAVKNTSASTAVPKKTTVAKKADSKKAKPNIKLPNGKSKGAKKVVKDIPEFDDDEDVPTKFR